MHEMAIIQSLMGIVKEEMTKVQSMVDNVKEEMTEKNAVVLKSVRMNIGRMTTVVPDAISFCFNIITKGTELEGAKLYIDVIPVTAECSKCSCRFEVKNFVFKCPDCGNTEVDIVSGQDLSIVEIEVE